ncbi:GNAT family N-acetyltransferase [Janibacter terrae]|uniref:GNAT family N-acetyltransferase n=1 Tax=Janibacter terrae TaxID=103817 RepID=A0ABZ2FF41_9MICO
MSQTVPMSHLLEWSGGDPVVRAEASSDVEVPALAIRAGAAWALAFVRPTHTHGVAIMLRGDHAALRELVGSAPFASWVSRARAKGASSVTLPRGLEDLGGLLGAVGGRWEFMSTRTAPATEPVEGLVELGPSERDEVQALLDMHNPGTDGQPFARAGQRWLGARDAAGALLAVGCCERERSGAPVLAGITTVPAARGRGLARAVTTELTRAAVAEHGWCTLGMYSHNDRARRIYLSLGYEVHAEWTSGRLA